MPPRLSNLPIALPRVFRLNALSKYQQVCPICSFSRGPGRAAVSQVQLQHTIRPRAQRLATIASKTSIDGKLTKSTRELRKELRDALNNLQKHAGSFINISRLQLALRGLEQEPGDETIRVAILGLADGGKSMKKAKELLRLLIADPLKPEEEWERALVQEGQNEKPLLIRVESNEGDELRRRGRLVEELHVSSPTLNRHRLEILVLEMDPPSQSGDGFTDALLVPTMEIPTSSTGRYTPVTSPVHKALVLCEGITGAASALGFPGGIDRDIIETVVDLNLRKGEQSSFTFPVVDVSQGSSALLSFRESVNNALSYEQNWFASGVPKSLEWLKSGSALTDGTMKLPVRNLLSSLLENTSTAIRTEQSSRLQAMTSAQVKPLDLQSLQQGLSTWAESAHNELRDELDSAFNGRRWRKLGWWKLFWRVDDVSMIAGDILNQRFLTDAEKEVIFLSGRISQAGVLKEAKRVNWAHKPVENIEAEAKFGAEPPPPKIQDLVGSKDHLPPRISLKPWPLQIPVTRAYLLYDTVPALQALAQKLVLQTFMTSSAASSFAGLMYFATLSTGLYEAGAVAALGIVWSLRRMQGKWESARAFWEGEVREEGRKAVKSVESAVTNVLATGDAPVKADSELETASDALERAVTALKAYT